MSNFPQTETYEVWEIRYGTPRCVTGGGANLPTLRVAEHLAAEYNADEEERAHAERREVVTTYVPVRATTTREQMTGREVTS